jgi:hypothetical protein
MKQKKSIAAVATVLLIAVTAGAWSVIRKRSRHTIAAPTRPVAATYITQGKSPQARSRSRNLSMQPEASAMARRLGSRFAGDKREKSVLIGTLTIGSDRRTVQTVRTQTDDGEEIEIKLAGSGAALTWDTNKGALSSGKSPNQADRDLIERLVFDSPDQFVLAQLRGASYFTVARNVRSADAGDNYNGPLWNIVRIDDQPSDETKAPQSRWRLYYVNALTGVIDRVESEIAGNRITAEFSGWTQQNGESFPTQIVWKQQGQTIMQYDVTNFSHADK